VVLYPPFHGGKKFIIRQPVLGGEVRKTFSYINYRKKASLREYCCTLAESVVRNGVQVDSSCRSSGGYESLRPSTRHVRIASSERLSGSRVLTPCRRRSGAVERWLGVALCLRSVSGGTEGVWAVVLCLDGVVGTPVVD